MRWLFAALLALHGLVHLMGFVKGFGLARVERLRRPVSRLMGLVWLAAAALMVAAAVTFIVSEKWFWLVGACALVLSQGVIFSARESAKLGSAMNGLLFLGVLLRFGSHGPWSLRAEYMDIARAAVEHAAAPRVVREEDLHGLPAPVQRYLRLTGAVGQPQIENFRATWRGRIRTSAAAPWTSYEAEQLNAYGGEASRLYFMNVKYNGLPADVLHRFVGDSATFRVRLLSLLTVADAKGMELRRAETVTIFNDVCLLAPARLADPSVRWEPRDELRARAHYTRGAVTISADLEFNPAGELVDFVSDDRLLASGDGRTFTRERWRTLSRAYRSVGARRVMTAGEARWEPETGPFAYAEVELVDIAYNVGVVGEPGGGGPRYAGAPASRARDRAFARAAE